MTKQKGRFEKRRAARVLGVQALYAIDCRMGLLGRESSAPTAHPIQAIASTVVGEFLIPHSPLLDDMPPFDGDLFRALVAESTARLRDVDHLITVNLSDGWSFDRMDGVLKAILRCGVGELLARPTTTPAPVIIGEYVDITNGFYDGQEGAYVNGFLDRLAVSLGYTMKRADGPLS